MILEVEKIAADKANQEREHIKAQNNFVKLITIVWYLVLIIFLVIFFKKKKESEKCEFTAEYLRDFPAEYGPEIVQYLTKKFINEQAMSASILMIIDKKALRVDKNTDKKDNYTLVKVEKYVESLTETEKIILDLLIDTVGDGKEVKLAQIKKYGNSSKGARKFMKIYNKWNAKSTSLGVKENFFENKFGLKAGIIFICIIGIVLFMANLALETDFIFGYIMIAVAIIVILVVLCTKFRTKKGVLHYKQWMALKKFMEDFGAMDIKELPELSIWGKYLVYATVLGCAKELEKTMKIRIQEISDDPSLASYYMYDSFTDNIYIMSSISSSVNSSIVSAVSSSRASIASSSSASSSGGGGGASFGGGSFGGGGGGGHF